MRISVATLQTGLQIVAALWSVSQKSQMFIDFFTNFAAICYNNSSAPYEYQNIRLKQPTTLDVVQHAFQLFRVKQFVSYLDDPKKWGPPYWSLFHGTALMYTPPRSNLMTDFLLLFAKVLPCDSCQENFWTLLADGRALIANTLSDFVAITMDLHQAVNEHTKSTKTTKYTLYRADANGLYQQIVQQGLLYLPTTTSALPVNTSRTIVSNIQGRAQLSIPSQTLSRQRSNAPTATTKSIPPKKCNCQRKFL